MLLFDFGAQVEGYRSDMTRTLFVGEPSARDLALYELVSAAQRAAIDALEEALAAGRPAIDREIDAAARSVIEDAGHGDALRPRARPRHRPRDPRAALARTARGGGAALADGLLGRAGRLPRRRDRHPHRGPRRLRHRAASRSSCSPASRATVTVVGV